MLVVHFLHGSPCGMFGLWWVQSNKSNATQTFKLIALVLSNPGLEPPELAVVKGAANCPNALVSISLAYTYK